MVNKKNSNKNNLRNIMGVVSKRRYSQLSLFKREMSSKIESNRYFIDISMVLSLEAFKTNQSLPKLIVSVSRICLKSLSSNIDCKQ